MLERRSWRARGKFRMSPQGDQNAGWVPHPITGKKDAIEREATGAKGQHPDSCTAPMGDSSGGTPAELARVLRRQEAKRESRYVPNSGRWMVVAGLYGFTALIGLAFAITIISRSGHKPFRGGFR